MEFPDARLCLLQRTVVGFRSLDSTQTHHAARRSKGITSRKLGAIFSSLVALTPAPTIVLPPFIAICITHYDSARCPA